MFVEPSDYGSVLVLESHDLKNYSHVWEWRTQFRVGEPDGRCRFRFFRQGKIHRLNRFEFEQACALQGVLGRQAST